MNMNWLKPHVIKKTWCCAVSERVQPHAVCPYGCTIMILAEVWLQRGFVNNCDQKKAFWHTGYAVKTGHFICLQISLEPTQLSVSGSLYHGCSPWGIPGRLASLELTDMEWSPISFWLISLATIPVAVLISPQAFCCLSVLYFFLFLESSNIACLESKQWQVFCIFKSLIAKVMLTYYLTLS